MGTDQLLDAVRRLPAASTGEAGVKGLMVGIAYALRQVETQGFVPRAGDELGQDYAHELDAALGAMDEGRALPDPWLAGFYFNSALIRIAAGSHRALREWFSAEEGGFSTLAARVVEEKIVREDQIALLRRVYQDVNDFKHDRQAKLLQRRRVVSLEDGITAASQLIVLLQVAAGRAQG